MGVVTHQIVGGPGGRVGGFLSGSVERFLSVLEWLRCRIVGCLGGREPGWSRVVGREAARLN